ncbi:GBS Bsp-like repeat-containing protein [Streptococcus sp. S784/96/1]|uniref:GBS Bsp-like repeat-containing protein n=1 Tax=Streptococcus sp. S784/96/1 TaxID=2653499 RepID=UPI0013874694|nr:GBS Bsp-like repeat-containing protein [Streptococcus sp. S784/96/1]
MKKKMYKAKKRWVVAGVAAAAFLTPSTLAQAEEQVSVSQTSAVVATETSESTTAPSETQTPVEVPSTSTTDSASQVADLPVIEAVTSSPEVSEASRVLTPEPKEEARTASRVTVPQVDTKLTEDVSKAKTSEAPVTDSTVQKPLTVTQGTESMTLTYTEEIPSESDLQVAVWSQAGDQDDLIWYSLPKGQATVPYNNHWEYGLYHLHAYFRQKATGKMNFIISESITLTPPKLDTQIKATSETSYEVTISNVPSYFHKLYVPIWSSVHDQDDLIWYEGQKQSDGRYKVSVDIDNHNSSTGLYYLHYYEGKPNGKKVYVGQASYAQPVPKAPTLSVSPRNDRQFEVTISNVPAKYTSVVLPTWTSQKDQDDLKWYRAQKHSDGTYRVTVSLDQHHFETEGYQLHLYGEVGEKKTFLAKASYNHPKTAVETTVVGVKNDQFAVTVRNVPSYIDQIRIPTWSDQNGQDDIRWYIAQKAGDGSYRLTVNIKDHQYASGLYHIHVYGNAGREENIFMNANKTYEVPTPKAETRIESITATSFKVTVRNVPSYLSTVILPTWSAQGDQDDLKWYQAQKQADGSYSLTVNIKDHQYDTGVYHIHSYGRTRDGKLIFLDGDKVTVKALPKPTATLAIENVNKEKGTFEVVVSDLKSVGGVSLVQLPTWSEVGGQDDIVWYTAARQADGNYRLTVRASDHKYTNGKYHVHLYVTNDGGKREFVANEVVDGIVAPKPKVIYNGLYYSIQGKYDNIIIANKKYSVSSQYAPGENPTAKAAFINLTNRMRSLGFDISHSYSGYRSYSTQQSLYWNYVSLYGQAEADRFSARAGHSEHQLGLAFDVLGGNSSLLAQPNAVSWLANHAHEYGFVVRYKQGKEHITGYMPEAWHIRFVGREATDIYHSGKSLEEYYGFEGGDYRN